MYEPFEDDSELNQGDIINNVVITYLPHINQPSFFNREGAVQKDLSQPFDPQEDLVVMGNAFKSPVMVITQGCDIDYRDYICVARILPFNEPDYENARGSKKPKFILNNYQRAGVRPTFYYLQPAPDPNFPRSVVSFIELHTIRKTPENLAYLKENRILRLMKEAVEDLQFRISFFFGRFAAITDDYMLTQEERSEARPVPAQPAAPE